MLRPILFVCATGVDQGTWVRSNSIVRGENLGFVSRRTTAKSPINQSSAVAFSAQDSTCCVLIPRCRSDNVAIMFGIEVDGDSSSGHCAEYDTGESPPLRRQVARQLSPPSMRGPWVLFVLTASTSGVSGPALGTQRLRNSNISDIWASVARGRGEHRVFPRPWHPTTSHSAGGRCVHDGSFG